MSVLNRVPVREQDPKVRATNFDEVCLGYNMEEAMEEASRCINCKNAKCIQGCPVSINIPAYMASASVGLSLIFSSMYCNISAIISHADDANGSI